MGSHLVTGNPQDVSSVDPAAHLDQAVPVLRVRCECQVCGAHTYAVAGLRIYGSCGNCRGVELVPLNAPGTPLVTAV